MALHFSTKDFCHWNCAAARVVSNHISAVWHDIEVNNFLIFRAHSALCDLHPYTIENDAEAVRQERMWIEVLEVLCKAIYRDLCVIVKLIQEDKKQTKQSVFRKLHGAEGYSHLEERILEIRNLIIEKRDKPNFYKGLGSCWSSAASGTDLSMLIQTKDGKRKTVQFDPLGDAEAMRQFLDIAFGNA